MREDICSIPISEIFEPKDGCPFCRMRAHARGPHGHLHYQGAAMMGARRARGNEPSRFCHQHFEQILQRGSRLSVALILESLLDEAAKIPARGRQARAEKNSRRRRSPCAQLLCLRKR